MKNIVFVIESLQCGGAEKSLITLLNLLDFKKYSIDLMLLKEDGEFEKFVPPQVNIIRFSPIEKSTSLSKLFKRLSFFTRRKFNTNNNLHTAQIYWSVFKNSFANNKKKYDIAIAYNQGFSTYYVASKISSQRKYAWLNTDYVEAGYNIKFDIQYYKTFKHIICVSNEGASTFLKATKSINKNLSTIVIKDISDSAVINKMSLESDGLPKELKVINILTVGRLASAKGYPLAIKACEILVKKEINLKWYVIGEGPDRNKLKTLIQEKKLQDKFILLGYKENPYPFIKSCDIYTQTSLFEGLGLTVIEASILNKPIVTTNFPTASSIIENEKTGLICEMDSKSIANSIEQYLNDSELMQTVKAKLSQAKNKDKEISLLKIDELLNE